MKTAFNCICVNRRVMLRKFRRHMSRGQSAASPVPCAGACYDVTRTQLMLRGETDATPRFLSDSTVTHTHLPYQTLPKCYRFKNVSYISVLKIMFLCLFVCVCLFVYLFICYLKSPSVLHVSGYTCARDLADSQGWFVDLDILNMHPGVGELGSSIF